MEMVTVSSLIKHFEEKVYHAERFEMGRPTGKDPRYPMMVVFLGNDAVEGGKNVAMYLCEMWPSYAGELLFLGITDERCGSEYLELNKEDGTVNQGPITPDEIGAKVSKLFDIESNFQDRSRLLIYYILDTTRFKNVTDYLWWIKKIKEARQLFVDNSIQTNELMIILLNESIGASKEIADGIKNLLSNEMPFSTLLISNRRSDHIILGKWGPCYKLIANTVALTNNSDTLRTQDLFNCGIYTAAYACEEKPVSKIGQVMIKRLLEHLANESFGTSNKLLSDKVNLTSKLGLSQIQSINILDSYADQVLNRHLPTTEQLELFPRKDCVEIDNLASITGKRFNELTMGCWDCFLSQIISRVETNVRENVNIQNNWREQYAKDLTESFTINELIWLGEHIDSIKSLLAEVRAPSRDVEVLISAEALLKYKLSSSPELVNVFIQTIISVGNSAETFMREWNKLIRSSRSVHAVNDENITAYYTKKAQNYFDYYGKEISERIRNNTNTESLPKVLYDIIDKMIDNDPIFLAPFEEEMESRLQNDCMPKNAKQYIREKLTGEKVPIFYSAQFSFGPPVASCILIKEGTQLYTNLLQNLPDSVYYYNTGNGNSAEAVYYYAVSTDNLISGEA